MDCIFCKIAEGLIPSDMVYQDEHICAFRDIAPVAPVHILVIPRAHIQSAAHITSEQGTLLAHIWTKIPEIAAGEGIDGFRVITNAGEDAGQTVFHLHFHIVGGRPITAPLG